MEEKKMNEEQVNETVNESANEQVNEMTELETLKAENKELIKKVDELQSSCNREYRKVVILKGAIKLLKKTYNIADGDYYAALISGGNGDLDIDTILYQLSK